MSLNRPYAELPRSAQFQAVIIWMPVGVLMMICHIMFARLNVALSPVMLLAMTWLFYRAPLYGTIVFFQTLLYGNVLISIFSVGMEPNTFRVLQGTNFFLLGLMAMVSLYRLVPIYNRLGGLMMAVFGALLLVGAYTGIGIAKSGLTSAMVYFREFSTPIFAAVVGLDVGRVWGFRAIATSFLYSAFPSLMLAVIEWWNPIDYYSVINAVEYYRLKYAEQATGNTFFVPEDIVKQYTSAFFNMTGQKPSDGLPDNFRFGGTIINPISYAYIIADVALVAISLRRTWWLFLTAPMLVLIGVKGALLLVVFSLAMWFIWLSTRNVPLVVMAGLVIMVVYVAGGLIIGLSNQDFHVIGFMGGVNGMVHAPWGHGIGVGGNLSADANNGFKWTGAGGFMSAGADFAVESAVGVLFYQMGLASVAIFAIFGMLLWGAPLGRLSRNARRKYLVPRREDMMFFAMAMVAVNGVFQEEAYAPYAAGLLMLFCGALYTNGRRASALHLSQQRTHLRQVATA